MTTLFQFEKADRIKEYLAQQKFPRTAIDIAHSIGISRNAATTILQHAEFVGSFERNSSGWYLRSRGINAYGINTYGQPTEELAPVEIKPVEIKPNPPKVIERYKAATLPLDEETLELARLAFSKNEPLIDYIRQLGWPQRKVFGKLIGIAIGNYENAGK